MMTMTRLPEILKAKVIAKTAKEVDRPIDTAPRLTWQITNALYESYGTVNYDKPTVLTPRDAEWLRFERESIDTVEKILKKRKADIKNMLFNHFDLMSDGQEDQPSAYILDDVKFTREVSSGAPSITIEGLERALADDIITKAEFNGMTSTVRVVDESKILKFIAKDDTVLDRIREYITPGRSVTSFHIRKT